MRRIRLRFLVMTTMLLPCPALAGLDGPRVSGTAHKALALSLAGTIVPVAAGGWLCTGSDSERRAGLGLIGAGLIAGPSAGYYYAGDTRRGNREILTHLAIVGAAGGGFALWIDSGSLLPGLFMLYGSVFLVAHVVRDVAVVPRAYRESAKAIMTPTILPGGKPGARLDVRF